MESAAVDYSVGHNPNLLMEKDWTTINSRLTNSSYPSIGEILNIFLKASASGIRSLGFAKDLSDPN